MENGGNLKVNAIFEASLARSGVQKPSNHADGPTRERFIRDKYERRKFYDPASFSHLPAPTSAPAAQQAQTEVGPPSDAARQRMEQRRLRKIQSAPATEAVEMRPPPKPARSSSTDRPRSRTPPRLNAKTGPRRTTRRQQSDESLEKEMDLLDLNFVAPAAAPETKPESSSHDLFNFLVVQDPAQNSQPKQQQPPKSSTLDIMSLYGSNNNNNEYQRQNSLSSFGNLTVSNIMDDASSMNSGGYTAQQMQQMGMRPNMMPNMHQQQQMMMMQQQQQMMMMQQQQQQQRMMMGNNNNNMMMMQHNAMNGFGAPMGSGPPLSSFQGQPVNKAPEKEDPFAQFGVNHFR
jgi:hypothetical protein